MASRTIFALASGAGRAAIAIIRVSGPRARDVFSAFRIRKPKCRFAQFSRLFDERSSEMLDDALVLWFPAPKSFTGEDTVELQIHGSVAVIDSVLSVLTALPGFDFAAPGEFTRQAFANGQMDLPAVEGLADLIDAETAGQRRQALLQMQGVAGREVEIWSRAIRSAQTLIEAEIDFSDESDVSSEALQRAQLLLAPTVQALGVALGVSDRGEKLRYGYRVAIIGAPNVGKSSLLNAFALREVAIVTEIPGTTRDTLEVRLDLGGVPTLLMDTAGLREGCDQVEVEGIRRALEAAKNADLVLLLREDRSAYFKKQSVRNQINVSTKADRFGSDPESDVSISTVTGEGLETLRDRMRAIASNDMAGAESAIISHRRQVSEAQSCLAALQNVMSASSNMPIEIVAEELRLANFALSRLVGIVTPEDVLSGIFARFCIGK